MHIPFQVDSAFYTWTNKIYSIDFIYICQFVGKYEDKTNKKRRSKMNYKDPAFKLTKVFALSSTSSSSSSMAALSSLFLSNPHHHHRNHHHHHRRVRHAVVSSAPVYLPVRSLGFSTKATQQDNRPTEQPTNSPSSPPVKKSFAVATGELFLGIASRIISTRSNSLIKDGEVGEGVNGLGPGVTLLSESGEAETWWRKRSSSKERIASVVEDPVQPEVVWEQRVKDVEAERGRSAVTSPGFSFSAAGLLFPYHLGVAQLLIEKGYIKVNPKIF